MSDAAPTVERKVPLVPEPTTALPALGSSNGLLLWLASVDHKQIGLMYLVTSLVFFLLGGLEALLLRLQLAVPRNGWMSPDVYNGLFTMHGTTMIFLFGMPAVFGLANYLIPLMIGANDVAFPRLNAFSLWVLVFGGLMLYFSFIAGAVPESGWFGHPPLSLYPSSNAPSTEYWALSLLVTGIGSVAGAVNLIVTVVTMRAPGMTFRRLPAMVWMLFFTMIIILFALPSLNAVLIMTLFDLRLGTYFFRFNPFDPDQTGHPLLYQHYFWSFGHPEVYILVLPFFGIISEVIPVFSRRPLYGYGFVIGSTVAITIYSFAVWGHHMWAAGMGFWLDIIFALGTFAIAVPTGVKIFNWLATTWGGAIRFTTAMQFALAFLVMFVMGGVTGVQFAVIPFDRQVTDTYYVVAHLHYVLFGGSAFAFYAGLYYWFPKLTGRLLGETLGRWHFGLMFLGALVTFIPWFFLGHEGMPREIADYPAWRGWDTLNLVSTIGSWILGIGVLLTCINVVWAIKNGRKAGNDPWKGNTLEWFTQSPPPENNFDVVPRVRSVEPMKDIRREVQRSSEPAGSVAQPVASGT